MAARRVEIQFLGSTAQLEAALTRAGLVADASGKKIGDSFTSGTTRAGGALEKLSATGASWGLPFMGSLDNIGKKLDEAHTKTQRFSTALQEAGKVTLLAGTVGFVAAGAEATKLGMAFQTAGAQVQGAAGISAAAAKRITDAFANTAGRFEQSGQQLEAAFAGVAGQLKLTEGHALSAAEAVKVMSAASDLAVGTQTDLNTATGALAQTMQAYHLSVGEARQASDVLFNVSKSLNTPINGVATAMARLHARLGAIAPSLNDTAGLMVTLGEHGLTGSRGIMVANTALQTLVGGSKKATEVLQVLGVHLFNQQGQFVGLQSVIGQLQPKLATLTQQQQFLVEKTLFGASAAQVMGQVVAAGVPKFQQATDAATKLGTAHIAAQAHAHTLKGEMELLKATVETLGGQIGLWLIPKLTAMGQWLADGVKWLTKHKDAAVLLGAAIAGPLALAVAAFVAGQAAAFIASIGRMGGAMISLVTQSKVTAGAVTAEGDAMVASADTTATGMNAALGATGVGLVLVGLSVAAGEMATHWSTVMSGMKQAAQAMVSFVDSQLNTFIAGLNQMIDAFNATVGQLTGTMGHIGTLNGNNLFGSSSAGMMDTPGGGVAPWRPPTNIGGVSPVSGHGPAWQQIAGALEGQGFSRVAIAGILGNFGQESGGQTITGINPGLHGASGLGIAQWIGSRRATEQQYAAIHHEPTNSLAAEVGFLINELRTTYHSAFTAIQNASSPAAAAAAFEKIFEGAGVPNMPARQRLANQAYQMLGGGGGGGGTGGGGAANSALGRLINGAAGTGHHARGKGALLYTDPLHGDTYNVERTDQGKDYGSIHGNIGAIGAGVITMARSLAGFGETIVERLTSGPNKGKSIYYGLETGAAALAGIHAGMHVGAGQALARGLGTGGVELGFWNQATGHAMGYRPGVTSGGVTPAGTAFANWMAALSKHSVYSNTPGGNIGYTLAQLEQAFFNALKKSGDSMLTRLGNVIQSGTLKTLTSALGVNTGGRTGAALHREIEKLPAGASIDQIDQALGGTIGRSAGRSQQGQAFNALVSELRATHQRALEKLANALVATHKAALATYAQELYAAQVTKDAELLNLQATQLKDQTTRQQNLDNALLNIAKAKQQLDHHVAQAQITQINDQTAIIKDTFAGMAQAVQDATQRMADAASGIVSGIQDQTAIKVDILGERGLYGLHLIAQQLKVKEDQDKAYWDQQINLAKLNVDTVTAQWHTAVATAQLNVEQVQAQQDLKVSSAQTRDDIVHMVQLGQIAGAQAHMDAVTLHEDTSVMGPAQMAVDLGAVLPKAQQDVLNAVLKRAQGETAKAENLANKNLVGVTTQANRLMTTADGALQVAQDQAATAIATAGQTLATVQGQAQASIDAANQNLQSVTDQSMVQLATGQAAVDIMTARASTQFAGTGTTVNVYGVPLENAAAIGDAVDWVARTALPAT